MRNEVLLAFADDLRLAGRAEWTIRKHVSHVRRLATWCKENDLDWQLLSKRELKTYARTIAGLGHSARSNAFCSWRRFYAWAIEEGHCTSSPAENFKTPAKPAPLPKALTLQQIRQVTSWCADQAGRRARRDECLIYTALYAGLRSAELARLRWSDIDQAEKIIHITLSKGRHGRAVPVHELLCLQLASWRTLQAPAGDWPVFSLDGKPLAPARPGKICRRISDASGVTFTTHTLRHTFATWTLRRSHDLYAVSKALGHKKLEQTEIYLSADPEYFRQAVDALKF